MDAKTSGIKVDKLRKAKDPKVILGCGTKEEAKKVTEKIKRDEARLWVEEAKNRNRLIMVKDVLTYNADGEILQAIKRQNKRLIQDLQDEDIEI